MKKLTCDLCKTDSAPFEDVYEHRPEGWRILQFEISGKSYPKKMKSYDLCPACVGRYGLKEEPVAATLGDKIFDLIEEIATEAAINAINR